MKRRFIPHTNMLLTLVTILLVFGWTSSVAQAAQQFPHTSTRTVTIMTRNMDLATDFGLVLGAQTLQQFLAGATATYQEVQASNIPERAQGIAGEIGATHPDLVGLQEVGLWRTGPLGQPPATTVQFDSLQSLLDALNQQGLSYTPVAIMNEFDLEGPSSLGFDVRVTDRDVILARTGDDAPELSNIQQQHYATNLTVPTIFGPVTDLRGWESVDVKIRGKSFRFVTTHLETYSASVQVAQGNELLQVPGNTSLPVVFAGDYNSAAGSGGPDQTPTYGNLIAAGLVDSWNVAHPGDPGYTWPLHGEDPYTSSSTPTERIDLVLFRGGFGTSGVQLIGNTTADLTPSGLWPSDHAGVVATLQLPK
jgi:endonuclease/exonuclease/phosphatase family metal-dependent hydrolase